MQRLNEAKLQRCRDGNATTSLATMQQYDNAGIGAAEGLLAEATNRQVLYKHGTTEYWKKGRLPGA